MASGQRHHPPQEAWQRLPRSALGVVWKCGLPNQQLALIFEKTLHFAEEASGVPVLLSMFVLILVSGAEDLAVPRHHFQEDRQCPAQPQALLTVVLVS